MTTETNTLSKCVEKGIALWKESDSYKHVQAVESMAYVHGAGEFKGEIIPEFLARFATLISENMGDTIKPVTGDKDTLDAITQNIRDWMV